MAQQSAVTSQVFVGGERAKGGLREHFFASTSHEQVFRGARSQVQDDTDPVMADNIVHRPSIKFHPSWEDYEARSKSLAAKVFGEARPQLPEGFPSSIEGGRVWSAQDVSGVSEFIEFFDNEDIQELEVALAHFKDLPGNNGPDQMSKELFPLPKLGQRLEKITKDLHEGRGISIIRGLTPSKYSPLDRVLLFAGLASYLGEQRGTQDRFGNMLTHLTDMSFKYGKCSKRTPTFTNGALPYHTDVCDILALFAIDLPLNGGESLLSPSAAVYNEIAATRPDVIKTLSEPVWIYDRDTTPENWYERARPILFTEPKHGPFFCFSRQKITGSEHYPLSASMPPMTEEQAEALDMVHFVAEKHGMRARLERGDILLYNNLAVLHGREAFRDIEPDLAGDARRRHIIRLWVRNGELAWKTPGPLSREWFQVYGDSERRAKAQWHIRPEDTDADRVVGHKLTCS